MPLAEISITKGTFDRMKIERLAQDLTTIFLDHQGAMPGSIAARAITCVEITEVDQLMVFVGGEPSYTARFRILFTVPIGSLSEERKQSLVDETTRLIFTLEGSNRPIEEAYHIWCLINEVPDGNWGAAGRVFRWRDIIRWVVRTDGQARRAARASAS